MSNPIENADAIKAFQSEANPALSKADKAFGLQIARQITSHLGGNSENTYYFNRNGRFRRNRLWAAGKVDMKEVAAMLGFETKEEGKNFVNPNWQCIKLGNRIISGLVNRWMGRNEKILVTAKDDLSVKDKQEEYEHLRYLMENKAQLQQIQAKSGVQMIPQGQYIPSSQNELDLWAARFQRLPEEICYQLGINDAINANGLDAEMKRKLLGDSSITGFVGTYTWMDDKGVIHIEDVEPENAIFSQSRFEDFRDATYQGQVRSRKISEIRRMYGKEFGGTLSEQQIYQIAQRSKTYQFLDKISYNNLWENAFLRPYDEANVDVVEFELRSVDSETVTITNTKLTGSTIVQKGLPTTSSGKVRPAKDNQQVLSDDSINYYRGVFIRDTDIMLEWGLKKNMVRPLDPKQWGNAESSYSFYMPQQRDMRNVAIPEKIEEPLKQMILTRQKIQLLIINSVPAGHAINKDAIEELDLGLGHVSKATEVKRIYNQTGTLYYKGRDAEGNPLPAPITELPNNGFAGQMEALINAYQFHYSVLKDELGEDPNLIDKAMQPRVAAGNVEASQEAANNATDHFYDAYKNVMEQTARKVSCFLHDSVQYGAQVYRQFVNPSDIEKREFYTSFQLLPTDAQVQQFESLMLKTLDTTPGLAMFVDPMHLCDIAREDVKMANVMFQNAQQKLVQYNQQQKQQDIQQNAQTQQQSLRMKAQQDQQLQKMKDAAEAQRAKERKEEIILTGVFQVMAKTGTVAPEWQPAIQELINNIVLPMMAQNVGHVQALGQALGDGRQQGQPQGDQGDQGQGDPSQMDPQQQAMMQQQQQPQAQPQM